MSVIFDHYRAAKDSMYDSTYGLCDEPVEVLLADIGEQEVVLQEARAALSCVSTDDYQAIIDRADEIASAATRIQIVYSLVVDKTPGLGTQACH